MARTPFFRHLRRALEQAHRADALGVSAAEIIERDREQMLLSRREFLATSAVAAGSVMLGGCASVGQRDGGGPVVIVGAGIAGLTAAMRLRQAGVPVRVYEAQNRVGGRMFSLRNFFPDGQVCELGGELIDTGHTHIRALATELGIELDDLSIEPPGISTETWFFGGMRRSDLEVVEAFLPIAARIRQDISGFSAMVSYRERGTAGALDSLSLAEWLERAGVSGWIRDLLAVGYTTEYGLELDQQSSLNLLLLVDPNPQPFRIFGDSDERFHVRGGNDLITQLVAARIEDAIETNAELEAITQSSPGGFTCSFRRSSSTFTVNADDVVLAIPFTTLRRVRLDLELPAVKRRAIDELGYGTNAKLMIGFSGRAWRERHRSNGSTLSDLPFQLVWETSRAQPGASGILTNFTGGRHGVELGEGPASQQAAAVVSDLERIYPGIAAERAGAREVRMHWPTHQWTLGSYAGYKPGQWTSIRGAEGEAVGRLYFAGEHCSLVAQGFMEGGCETGERAAREVSRTRGIRTGWLRLESETSLSRVA